MKKNKLNLKLEFKKETIANLNQIHGGGDEKATFSLWSCEHSTKPKSCCQTGCQDTCPSWTCLEMDSCIRCIN
ncbi:MAG: class I lanthipeptide [Bacteroidota bacterium]